MLGRASEGIGVGEIGHRRIEVGSRTDVGRVRENNEDCYAVVPELGLFLISDGMGGEAHGEVASALAINTIVAYCREAAGNPSAPQNGEQYPNLSERTNRLASAAILANQRIYEESLHNPSQRGMGATVVAAWLDGQLLSLVHVGDSRAYLLRVDVLERLTSDHTLVAEQVRRGILTAQQAEMSKLQSVLMEALGMRGEVKLDADERLLLVGDLLLLCSDGLTRMVPDSEIADTLLHVSHVQQAAESLVALANQHGGEDNVSVIVIRIVGNP